MPAHNSALDDVPLSVFEPIVTEIARRRQGVIPLHQGKTAYTTPVALRDWTVDEFDHPSHHDGPSAGTDTLLRAIRDKLQAELDREIDRGRIQVTSGITHALSIVFHSVLEPGDEVLMLSPQWLFANGLVRAARGVPIEVPFFPVSGEPMDDVRARIEPWLTAQTRAIYFNTPNNPTGRSLSAQQIQEIVDWAGERGLWVVSDNAYEYYDYTEEGFVDPAGFADNAFAAYSFSKSYGLTGYRIGYLLSPPSMAETVRKFGLYSVYSIPTCTQFAALSALRAGPEVITAHRRFMRDALESTIRELAVPATRPDGGFYTFLDLSAWPSGAEDFVARCLRAGVSLAPGHAFGAEYGQHARLCYSVVDHEDLVTGIRIINHVYESAPTL